MSFIKILLIGTLYTTAVHASDTDQLLGALSDASWASKYETEAKPVSRPATVDDSLADSSGPTTTILPTACKRSAQTSLPQKVLKSLLSKRDFDFYHNPDSGKLTINGGTMISNCNNMLQFNLNVPKNGRPYIFETEVRKPATGCELDDKTGKTLCEYEVVTATDGIPDDQSKKIKVEPNYYGFIQCLRKTGVMNGNAIIPSKIAPVKFKVEKTGAFQTAELAYYCHGPECSRPKMRLAKKNKIEGASCQWFEDVKKGGYTLYSVADRNYNNKRSQFKSVCGSGDYKQIDKLLPEFSEFKTMYNILKNVRNNLIEEEVKKLHKSLEAKSYAKLNPNKFHEVLDYFYKYIIEPKRKAIEAQIRLVDSLPNGQQRKKAQKKLIAMTKDLEAYNKKPYLTGKDYENMLSFIKKAPLKESQWRKAALKLFASQNTAFHMSRYNPTKAKARKLEDIPVDETLALIQNDIDEEEAKIKKIGVLANDTKGEVSYAANYRARAEGVMINHSNKLKSLQEEYMHERQYEMQNCYNAQAGMWGLVQQNCIKTSKMYQSEIMNDHAYFSSQQYVQKAVSPRVQDYMGQSNMWAELEAQRNKAYEIQPRQQATRLGVDPYIYNDPRYSQMMQKTWDRNNTQNGYDMFAQMLQMQALQRQQGLANQNYSRYPAAGQQPMYQRPMYQQPMIQPSLPYQYQYQFQNQWGMR